VRVATSAQGLNRVNEPGGASKNAATTFLQTNVSDTSAAATRASPEINTLPFSKIVLEKPFSIPTIATRFEIADALPLSARLRAALIVRLFRFVESFNVG
jgi:hypothetical protein